MPFLVELITADQSSVSAWLLRSNMSYQGEASYQGGNCLTEADD